MSALRGPPDDLLSPRLCTFSFTPERISRQVSTDPSLSARASGVDANNSCRDNPSGIDSSYWSSSVIISVDVERILRAVVELDQSTEAKCARAAFPPPHRHRPHRAMRVTRGLKSLAGSFAGEIFDVGVGFFSEIALRHRHASARTASQPHAAAGKLIKLNLVGCKVCGELVARTSDPNDARRDATQTRQLGE